MRRGQTLLLNWLGLEPGAEPAFDLWHNREHAAERVGLPGFRRCRRYVSAKGSPTAGSRYLIVYEGDGVNTFSSADYCARLNDPTVTTAAVVPRLRQVRRAVLVVENAWNVGIGTSLCTVAFSEWTSDEVETCMAELESLPAITSLVHARRAGADSDIKSGTVEDGKTESLGADVETCVLVEASRPDTIEQAADLLLDRVGHLSPKIERFQLAYILDAPTQR